MAVRKSRVSSGCCFEVHSVITCMKEVVSRDVAFELVPPGYMGHVIYKQGSSLATYPPVILALERPRQEDREFQDSLGYTARYDTVTE